MNKAAAGPEIWDMNDNRFAFCVDGVVRYVGSLPECERRKFIYTSARITRDTSNELLRAIR